MASKQQRPIVKFWRDDDLPGVEIRFSSLRTAAFPKHTHDCYSVGVSERGESAVFLGGRHDVMVPGEIAVMHPGEVHACNPRSESGWTYRLFHIDTEVMDAAAAGLWDGARPEPGFTKSLFRDPALNTLFTRLQLAVAAGAEPLAKESLLEAVLARLLLRHGEVGRGPRAGAEQGAVRTVREYLRDNAAETVRLEDLASVTGLSRYSVLRAFRRATGLSPHAYQTQLRIARAKRLMRGGAGIADAALEAGYADQSHFTTAFRKVTAATPNQYRQTL